MKKMIYNKTFQIIVLTVIIIVTPLLYKSQYPKLDDITISTKDSYDIPIQLNSDNNIYQLNIQPKLIKNGIVDKNIIGIQKSDYSLMVKSEIKNKDKILTREQIKEISSLNKTNKDISKPKEETPQNSSTNTTNNNNNNESIIGSDKEKIIKELKTVMDKAPEPIKEEIFKLLENPENITNENINNINKEVKQYLDDLTKPNTNIIKNKTNIIKNITKVIKPQNIPVKENKNVNNQQSKLEQYDLQLEKLSSNVLPTIKLISVEHLPISDIKIKSGKYEIDKLLYPGADIKAMNMISNKKLKIRKKDKFKIVLNIKIITSISEPKYIRLHYIFNVEDKKGEKKT